MKKLTLVFTTLLIIILLAAMPAVSEQILDPNIPESWFELRNLLLKLELQSLMSLHLQKKR